ncbi:hypothetical protein BGZ76_003603 [Entomortierella beljakovae]|nr:hypothetical protein BGZ76_003603 [Entomortierella beljakovae]
MTTSLSKEQSPLTSPDSSSERDTSETIVSDPTTQTTSSATAPDEIQNELEEADQEEDQSYTHSQNNSNNPSPFLIEQEVHLFLETPKSDKSKIVILPDGDIGLNSLTPTRPRTRRSLINPFFHQKRITRSSLVNQDKVFNLDDDDQDNDITSSSPSLRHGLSEIKPPDSSSVEQESSRVSNLLVDCEGNVNNDNVIEITSNHSDDSSADEGNEDSNTFSIPMTPKKPRQPKLFDLERFARSQSGSPSNPTTPGTLLNRWKYDIMMKHSSMKPPNLTQDDLDDSPVKTHNLLPLDLFSTEQDLMLNTPTKARKPKLDYHNDPTNSESNSDNDESSDFETQFGSINQGKKRRSEFDSDDYGYDSNNETTPREIKDMRADKMDSALPILKKQPKLDFGSPDRFPVTPVKQKQPSFKDISSVLFTPPSKRFFQSISSLKPPRAPILSEGNLPMFRPDSLSDSPSQRQRRPFSLFEELSQSGSKGQID